jgi:hypothetical protein
MSCVFLIAGASNYLKQMTPRPVGMEPIKMSWFKAVFIFLLLSLFIPMETDILPRETLQ